MESSSFSRIPLRKDILCISAKEDKSSKRSESEQKCPTRGKNLLDTLRREKIEEKLARWLKAVSHQAN